ncbi:MAG: GNAT family N-acetyltransferase [Pseudomonadota bacterium]
MPDGDLTLTARVIGSIHDIDASDWDACAGKDNPFLTSAFLSCLEDSGSVGANTGWLPYHIVLEDQENRIVAVTPTYLKGHSYGEYVFDHGWAHAYERAGGRYYPKLQCSIPFTPASGQRLLVRKDLPPEQMAHVRDAAIAALVEVTRSGKFSSVHITFPTEHEWERCGSLGMMQRTGVQYHWHNDGYSTFDDFLNALSSRKRKAIRKERRDAVNATNLAIRRLIGPEIEPRHWDAFFRFYMDTSDRKWGSPYLTREFFEMIGDRVGETVMLVVGEDSGTPIAGALNFIGADTLFGRNWGCDGEFYKFLHFEACYYQAIDFAIERGLKRVEAGAQGHHKIQRGYLPVKTYSAHWVADSGFADAVSDFLHRENNVVDYEIASLMESSPFRKVE